jgi:hypothetical protein
MTIRAAQFSAHSIPAQFHSRRMRGDALSCQISANLIQRNMFSHFSHILRVFITMTIALAIQGGKLEWVAQ